MQLPCQSREARYVAALGSSHPILPDAEAAFLQAGGSLGHAFRSGSAPSPLRIDAVDRPNDRERRSSTRADGAATMRPCRAPAAGSARNTHGSLPRRPRAPPRRAPCTRRFRVARTHNRPTRSSRLRRPPACRSRSDRTRRHARRDPWSPTATYRAASGTLRRAPAARASRRDAAEADPAIADSARPASSARRSSSRPGAPSRTHRAASPPDVRADSPSHSSRGIAVRRCPCRNAATRRRNASCQYCIGGGVPGSGWSPCVPFGPGGGTSTGSPTVAPGGIVLPGDGRGS